jgi:aspartyl-tRNA synthetase
MHAYRTHTCSELRQENIGDIVRLSGWIHRKRDHGGVLFIDIRDTHGLTQCVIDEGSPLLAELERVRPESVITVTGEVRVRPGETQNANMPTGEIELYIKELEVQGAADVLPFQVAEDDGAGEEIRLKYRYLDLRREKMQKNIRLRNDVITSMREKMRGLGFQEFQTPILTASSPEGARDFLVPSRLNPGKFYALPQAPQQFKQLLMMSGFDKYFQIAPCFRDEDSRADRSPGEFYQLDMEMSFVTQDDVFNVIEPVMRSIFEEFGGDRTIHSDFVKIPYLESMMKYGSDKPDLRNPLTIVDVTEVFARDDVEFKAFKGTIEKGGVVRAIRVPKVADQPRSFFDKLNSWAQGEGAPGLGYVKMENGVGAGPIAKFIPEAAMAEMTKIAGLEDGDAIFFICNKELPAAKFAGLAREAICNALPEGHEAEREQGEFKFCWIVDYPMFEMDDATGKREFSHNPFSMPQGGMEALETMDPLDILAWQYDIVCNGVELSSGAIRNHKPEIMAKAFDMAGYDQAVLEDKFGGMLNAMKFGAPPHGGIAPGVDRIVMLLADEPNIREVIVFPMNGNAEDLMMKAPSTANAEQLKELHIKLDLPKVKVAKDEAA